SQAGCYVSKDPNKEDYCYVKEVVVGAVHPDADEEQDGWVDDAVWDGEHTYPHANQGDVQYQQDKVTNPEAHDEAPEYGGVFYHQLWSGLDVVNHHGAEHQCHDSVTRYPQA